MEQDQTYSIRNTDMPEAYRVLLDEHPRDGWEAHPGFHQPTRNWLGAHRMFRRVAKTIRSDAEDYLDQRVSRRDYIGRLGYYGDALVRNLHGHHHFEDTSYFPELLAADARFAGGLEILERDHETLDTVLHDFTEEVNNLITGFAHGATADESQVGRLHKTAEAIEALLTRHLADEEELAVPIILHYRLRG